MIDKKNQAGINSLWDHSGFTLIEVLSAIVISAVAVTAMVATYNKLQNVSTGQVSTNMLQQNLRGALSIMEKDIRGIGANENTTNQRFEVMDVRRFSIEQPGTNATPLAGGSQILQMRVDLNNNGNLDPGETITYLLFDRDGNPDTGFDLGRTTVAPVVPAASIGGFQLMAEGIEAMGMLFAFDANGDGRLDRDTTVLPPRFPPLFWATDTDNDGNLDTWIDIEGNRRGILPNTVRPNQIGAIRIAILGRSKKRDLKHEDSRASYQLLDRVVGVNNLAGVPYVHGGQVDPQFKRWVVSETWHLRNIN